MHSEFKRSVNMYTPVDNFIKCSRLQQILTTIGNAHNFGYCSQMLTIPENAHDSRKCSQLWLLLTTVENAHNFIKCSRLRQILWILLTTVENAHNS